MELTDYFLDDFRVLELDVPEKRKYIVDDGRLVQSVDDFIKTGENVQRQLQIAGVALVNEFRIGQDHFTNHLVVEWRGDVGHRHQSRTL